MAAFDIGLANLLGIAVYSASALVATVTAVRARRKIPGAFTLWISVALFFVGLAAFRLFGAEDAIRQALRGMLVERMEYGERRTFQTAALFACLLVVGIGVYFHLPRMVLWPLWRATTAASVFILLVLYSLRIISLHGVDQLLYASIGPVHFNHLLELMPIAAICFAAWQCMQIATGERRGRPAPNRV